MTITSYGYAADVDAAAWSRIHPEIGSSTYGVVSNTAWKVAPAAGTRTVSIQPGNGWGKGVFDVSSAVESLTFPSQPTGVRYDLVVMRRTWPSGPSVFAVVAGGSTKAIPSRAQFSGVGSGSDEQPLALVQVTAGSSAVQVVADLRVVAANGGLQGFDDLARSYMTDPGTTITIAGKRWQRIYNATGSLVWDQYDDTDYTVLWSGANFMHETQVAALSQLVSAQKTGIVLVWSRFNDTTHTAQNDTWTYIPIPRWHTTSRPGGGSSGVPCPVGNFDSPIVKYVYVDDNQIRGNTQNDAGTQQRSYVLRYVLGY